MANWMADWLATSEFAQYPITQRARHSVHVQQSPGVYVAEFTGAPCHYQDTNGDWLPLDTAIKVNQSGHYYAPGVPALIQEDGTVRTGNYSQLTRRAGLLNTVTRNFSMLWTLPAKGAVSNDSVIRGDGIWEHHLTLKETGLREELILLQKPNIQAGANDYLVLETLVSGVDLPDGWVNEWNAEGVRFPLPVAQDAIRTKLTCQRYARNVGNKLYIYTGIPIAELESAVYPVVIDPDFGVGSDDGYIYGRGLFSFTTARNTSYASDDSGDTFIVGLDYASNYHYVYRGFLRFDTSTIGANSSVTQVVLKMASQNIDIAAGQRDFDVQIFKCDWSSPLSGSREGNYDLAFSASLDDNIWKNTNDVNFDNLRYSSPALSGSWVKKTGYTSYALRSEYDTSACQAGNNEMIYLHSQAASSSYRPLLTITYTAGLPSSYLLINRIPLNSLFQGRLVP